MKRLLKNLYWGTKATWVNVFGRSITVDTECGKSKGRCYNMSCSFCGWTERCTGSK